MKKILKYVLVIVFILAVGWAIYYLAKTGSKENQSFDTTKAFKTNIYYKAIATGEIKPREVIEIKPNISGVISTINVTEGQIVKKGELIAIVKVIPNVASLNAAQQAINSANIALTNQKQNFARTESLYEQGVIPRQDYDNAQAQYKQAQQQLQAAQYEYKVAQTGVAPGLESYATTHVRATSDGMILSIPVEVGNTVQEINNFSMGTTICTMADVSQMIFQGNVDESEVGKLKEGMPVKITIGALPNSDYNAILDFISPDGVESSGVVQFEIKAAVELKEDTFLRSGYSANAEIILADAKNVTTLKSAHIRYDDDGKPYVEVLKTVSKDGSNPQYEKRFIELGLTDGINTEIKKGITENDVIKIWNTDLKK